MSDKLAGNWLWFLVWRKPSRQANVTAICNFSRIGALEEARDLFGDEWPQAKKEGARIERIFVEATAPKVAA